jgi:hypothetical protein
MKNRKKRMIALEPEEATEAQEPSVEEPAAPVAEEVEEELPVAEDAEEAPKKKGWF